MIKVLFVCLGNICRSPTAHGVFENLLEKQGLQGAFLVDSAGTGAWHAGNPPDARAQAAAQSRGINLSHIRARQVEELDFEHFDYILAMDNSNFIELNALSPPHFREKISLLLSFSSEHDISEVPDPYYGGVKGFETVLNLVEKACIGLLEDIKQNKLI